MDATTSSGVSIPESVLQPFIIVSNSSTLDKSLENLIESARTNDGRSDLASKNMVTTTLQLCQSLSYPSCGGILLLALKLVRNLCAGELRNQDSFIEQNGVDIVSNIICSEEILNDSNYGIIRMGLQVLANVSLAGKEHQVVIWDRMYSLKFVEIAKLRRKDTCDPLCMIIYTCVDGNNGLIDKLCSDNALPLLVEIVRTASVAGFGEDWLKLVLSRTCVEESYFTPLFSKLQYAFAEISDGGLPQLHMFTQDQLFLLSILSEIINEQIEHITVSKAFAFDVFQILKTALRILDRVSRPKSTLPTGSIDIDALGYSLCILRDICAFDGHDNFKEGYVDIVELLLSLGLIETLLDLLRDLEPPAIIRRTVQHGENQDSTSSSGKVCPYKGFRSDIVAVIGNCAYRRKHVQDEIRAKNGILLMLQQCVTDDENPFLREWGIWGVRNLLEGNGENQRLVGELEIQGSVDLPELSGLGLRMEVDQKTRRAKLVNTG
ncbi:ataxin-10 [Cynara cardunculus var. scolymus]|uniref:ataxin-10 n=1 Tax=Cynara cardunculus var. scolymus TaxID=59895 RepID=UPI000D62D529|nr:ataxin-10 [Cynara cardunculus var. scolymus]